MVLEWDYNFGKGMCNERYYSIFVMFNAPEIRHTVLSNAGSVVSPLVDLGTNIFIPGFQNRFGEGMVLVKELMVYDREALTFKSLGEFPNDAVSNHLELSFLHTVVDTFYRPRRHLSISDFFVLFVQKPWAGVGNTNILHTYIHQYVNLSPDIRPMVKLLPHVPILSCREPLSSTPVHRVIPSCFRQGHISYGGKEAVPAKYFSNCF